MKLVKAYIRHRKTEEVFLALKAERFGAVTMVECEGTGKYTDNEKMHLSEKYPFADSCKVTKLELLVPDSDLEKVVDIIRENGKTGHQGDGMILVSKVDEVHKIKNHDSGIEAI